MRAMLVAAVLVSCPPAQARAVSDLAIWVNPDGTSFLWNTTDSPVQFLGWQIQSEGNLNPAGFKGVSDYVAAGEQQAVIDALGPGGLHLILGWYRSEDFLMEVGGLGTAVLQGGDKFFVGRPFKTVPPSLANRGEWAIRGEFPSRKMDIVYVPEPSTWLLATLAGLGLLAMRRRRNAPL